METVAFTSQAPVMPAAWPQGEQISNPDRENILKEFFKETYV